MYTITISRSGPKSQTRYVGTQNVQIWTKKGSKMGVARFFPDCKPQFFREDNNIGFYTKNQQNLTSHLEDIS